MTLIDLSKYRLAKATETLENAKRDMNAEIMLPQITGRIIAFFMPCAL